MRISLVTRLSLIVSIVITLSFASWVVIVHRSTRSTFVDTQSERRERTIEPGRGGMIEREEHVVTLTSSPDDGSAFAWQLWRSAAWWLAAVLAVAVAAIVWVMRRALVPIDRMTQAARDLRHGQPPAPVPLSGPPEFADLTRAFESAAQAIAGTEQLRRQVIADVGHELRTPVTNLRAQLEAMQLGLVPVDADALQALQVEARLLQRLVEDFEQLTLADAGRVKLYPQVLPLRDSLTDILAPLADAADARWSVNGPADLCVTADEARLRQVVTNLVENAARHRPANLQVDVVVSGIGDHEAAFTFRDNGPGVAADDIPHIFERFYRADRSRNRATGGSGLGLAITRGLVEAMGGNIRYESHPDAGAVFVVTLPRATCE